MPLLTKEILPVRDDYKVRRGSERVHKAFDEAYIRRIAAQSNKMIGAGLVIPAPFDHVKEAVPRTRQEIAVNKAASSFNNAGEWKSFWVAPNEKGVPALYGQVDAPGSETDKDSPYYKLKNTCKEVSVSLADNYEDGLGRTWTDGLLHVAVVNHAIVPNQSPFEDSVTIVNMSMVDPDDDILDDDGEPGSKSEGAIGELKTALQSKLNVVLPSDTSPKTFMRDLLTAVLNVPTNNNNDVEPIPVYMSIGDSNDMGISQAQAEALVATKALNPATNQPFTMEDLGFKKAPVAPPANMSALSDEVAELKKENTALRQVAGMLKKQFEARIVDGLRARLDKLQAAGLNKEFIEKQLVPQLNAYNMSAMPDGSIAPHPLEITLSALETTMPTKTPAPPNGLPFGADILPFDDGSGDVSTTDMDKEIDSLFATL